LGNGTGCPLVVHCWADLQSLHGFRCYDKIVANAKCQRVLVVALSCHSNENRVAPIAKSPKQMTENVISKCLIVI